MIDFNESVEAIRCTLRQFCLTWQRAAVPEGSPDGMYLVFLPRMQLNVHFVGEPDHSLAVILQDQTTALIFDAYQAFAPSIADLIAQYSQSRPDGRCTETITVTVAAARTSDQLTAGKFSWLESATIWTREN